MSAAERARRAQAWLARIPGWGWVVLLSLATWAVYGLGSVGYDSIYLLLWGDDVIHGDLPDYASPHAPTPHPLANLIAIPLALLGKSGALYAFQLLTIASFGALGYVSFLLGRQLFSVPVGVLFALFLLTRPLLVRQVLVASIDIWFLFLIVLAMLLEARRPRRGAAVLAVLALAGLLRPEAWLLAGVYWLWLWPASDWPRRIRHAALVAAAPLLWALADLVVMGDPVFSLFSTQEATARIDYPTGIKGAFNSAPRYIQGILHTPLAVGGFAGAALALWLRRRGSTLPAAMIALGSLSFLLLGLGSLPLVPRYFFVVSACLALFAAFALVGWHQLAPGTRGRRLWIAAAALALVVSIPSLTRDWRNLDRRDAVADRFDDYQHDLFELVESRAVRDSFDRCPLIWVHNFRIRPMLIYALRDPYIEPEIEPFIKARRGLILHPAVKTARFAVPPGFRLVDFNKSWALWERCPSPRSS